jgi:hypothetical protein
MSSDPQLLASLPANNVEDEKVSYVFSVPEFESQYGQEFSPLQIVQTDFGAHPAYCSLDTGGKNPRYNRSV